MTDKTQKINFSELLTNAVSQKGRLLEAYSSFHNYSFANQLLALQQCEVRGLKISPLSTFLNWQKKGRRIKKGQKALHLCMPVSFKKEVENIDGEILEETKSFFVYRSKFFLLSQTDGDEINDQDFKAKDWSKDDCLKNLNIKLTDFDSINGNTQGYATKGRKIAINPLAQLPLKTLFHELGHIVLDHTEESRHGFSTPKNIQEVEAESVALLCLTSLGLKGQEYCRGYIQHWLEDNSYPEKSAKKVINATDLILKAGRNELKKDDENE